MAGILSLLGPVQVSRAQVPLHDPALPSVAPEALQHLSDNRIKQKIMLQSRARYSGRCVCPHDTEDDKGRSCKGRHERIKTPPKPLCRPMEVTGRMIQDWKRANP
jgi:hypothetical protein